MRLSTLILMGSSLATGLIVASATPAQAETPPSSECASVASAGQADSRLISRILDVRECWPAETDDGSQRYLNDLYTRWVVEEVASNPAGMVRDYKSERRSALERLFLGKTRNTTISLKIHMRDPDVDFTLPLMAVDYSGKRGEGQTFNTILSRSDMSLPDFPISPMSSASFEASARSSTDIDVQAAGIVLGTLRDTLAIAAPGSSLLTSVNREQVQRTATAYDKALSQLLSSSVGETMTSGRMLSEWEARTAIYISVALPRSIRTLGDRDDPRVAPDMRRITFRISMTCPRISIFDTLNVCAVTNGTTPALISSTYPNAAPGEPADSDAGWPGWNSDRYKLAISRLRGRLSAHQVLSFKVGPAKSLRQFLTEQEWFISLSKAIVTVPPEDNVDAARAAADRPTTPPAETSGTDPAEPVASGDGPSKPSTRLGDSNASANELCEAITEKLYSAGLSRLDANIGLWATITGMADFSNSRGIFQNASSCREHMPIGPATGVWRFEEPPARERKPSAPSRKPPSKKKPPARRR
jgi:hypothetical protein